MRKQTAGWAWAVILIFAFAANQGWAQSVEGAARVVDGDTLVVAGERIRLWGINAPESKQTCTRGEQAWECGQAATQALRAEVGGRAVRCQGRDRDAYGRLVAICVNHRGADLAQTLVETGWAQAYRRYTTAYVPAETRAKAQGRGVWAGEFQDPEAYRHGRSSRSSNAMGSVLSALHSRVEVRRRLNPPRQRAMDHLRLPSQDHRAEGQPVGGLSAAQFCALAEIANRPCH